MPGKSGEWGKQDATRLRVVYLLMQIIDLANVEAIGVQVKKYGLVF